KVSANAVIQLTVSAAYELAFTYDGNSGNVALDDSKLLTGLSAPDNSHPLANSNHQMAIFATASFAQGFDATVILGFEKGVLTPISGQPNAFNVTVAVDQLSGEPAAVLDGAADANLQFSGGFTGTDHDFPGVDCDFHLHWDFDSANPSVNVPQV